MGTEKRKYLWGDFSAGCVELRADLFGKLLHGIRNVAVFVPQESEALSLKMKTKSLAVGLLVSLASLTVGCIRPKEYRPVGYLTPLAVPPTPDATEPDSIAVDRKIDLEVVLGRLDPPHREILLLREMQQMSYEEIAASLGVPRGTVESRLHRARAELKRQLKDYKD